jgi:multidrug efflux pump subunit AcrA (membrane-fusion protein)
VGIRNINIGDYVKDGADLVNIEDLSSMYVDFKLPERFQGKLRRDQQVELQLDAMPGRVFKAKVEAIDPQIDANGRSISVRAVLPNTGGEPMRAAGGPAGAASGARAGAPVAAVRPVAKPAGAVAGRPAQRASGAGASGSGAPRAGADAVVTACAPFSEAARAVASRAGQGRGAASAGGGPLRPGMFARVNTVFTINDKSLTVPEEAIVPQGGRQFVIKVVQQTEAQAKALAEAAKQAAAVASASSSTAGGATPPAALTGFVDGKRLVSQRTEVKIGIRRPGRVEITEGVAEGDTVVVAGQQRLQRDNTPVRVVELGRQGGGGGSGAAGVATSATTAPSLPPATPAPANSAASTAGR